MVAVGCRSSTGLTPYPVFVRFGEGILILLHLSRQPHPHPSSCPTVSTRKLFFSPRTIRKLYPRKQYWSIYVFLATLSLQNLAALKKVMPGLWMSPESLKELRLTFKASKSPLEKWPGTLLCHMVHGSLSRSENYWKVRTQGTAPCSPRQKITSEQTAAGRYNVPTAQGPHNSNPPF